MTNQSAPALPFFPPREPEDLIKDVDAVARRLIELDGTAFEAMFQAVSGWDSMPPRQRFALLANAIRSFDVQNQQKVQQIDQMLATPPTTPEEMAIMQQSAPMMMAEREQIVTQVLPNPGVAFFSQLASIDAKKTQQLSEFYARALKTYGATA